MQIGANDDVEKDELAGTSVQSLIRCPNDLLREEKSEAIGIDLQGEWVGYEEGIRYVEVGLRNLCFTHLNEARP